jgi:hypothetical protein
LWCVNLGHEVTVCYKSGKNACAFIGTQLNNYFMMTGGIPQLPEEIILIIKSVK